jgi:hypothetical protein
LDVLIDGLGAGVGLGLMFALLAQRERHPLWFQQFPWLERLLSEFLPVRLASQEDAPE